MKGHFDIEQHHVTIELILLEAKKNLLSLFFN